jgi:hypothetical protein
MIWVIKRDDGKYLSRNPEKLWTTKLQNAKTYKYYESAQLDCSSENEHITSVEAEMGVD